MRRNRSAANAGREHQQRCECPGREPLAYRRARRGANFRRLRSAVNVTINPHASRVTQSTAPPPPLLPVKVPPTVPLLLLLLLLLELLLLELLLLELCVVIVS